MEDRIPKGLQHRHKTCCEKGGRRGRRACMVQKWFHHRDIISVQVDLHMTSREVPPGLGRGPGEEHSTIGEDWGRDRVKMGLGRRERERR